MVDYRRRATTMMHADAVMSAVGLPSDFVRKGLLVLRSGYVRELAAASYPHIHRGGGDFPFIAGGGCGGWRLREGY